MHNPYREPPHAQTIAGKILNIVTLIIFILFLPLTSLCVLSTGYQSSVKIMGDILSEAFATGILTINGMAGYFMLIAYFLLCVFSGISLTFSLNAAWQEREFKRSVLISSFLLHALILAMMVFLVALFQECILNVAANGNETCSIYFGSPLPIPLTLSFLIGFLLLSFLLSFIIKFLKAI